MSESLRLQLTDFHYSEVFRLCLTWQDYAWLWIVLSVPQTGVIVSFPHSVDRYVVELRFGQNILCQPLIGTLRSNDVDDNENVKVVEWVDIFADPVLKNPGIYTLQRV